MDTYDSIKEALVQIGGGASSATLVATSERQSAAALAVCAAYERALLPESGGMKIPSFFMAALEMLCKECGR